MGMRQNGHDGRQRTSLVIDVWCFVEVVETSVRWHCMTFGLSKSLSSWRLERSFSSQSDYIYCVLGSRAVHVHLNSVAYQGQWVYSGLLSQMMTTIWFTVSFIVFVSICFLPVWFADNVTISLWQLQWVNVRFDNMICGLCGSDTYISYYTTIVVCCKYSGIRII